MMAEFVHVVCSSCGSVNRVPLARPAREAKCGSCRQPLFAGTPVSVDAKSFDRQILRSEIPVVVDFWAPWCGPCRAMAPALEGATTELEPRYRVLKVNIEREQALASRYNVLSIPTLMLFIGGHPVARSAGAMDKAGILSWVRAHEPFQTERVP